MDQIEAHFLVKWEREAIVHRAAYSATAGVPYDETKWVGKLWFEDEDG
jgi:hypothetical protein